MLVQGERGRFSGERERRDCVDDLPRSREVVVNPDCPAAATFTVDDFPARRNFSSGRLLDCQGPKADEKIVGPVTFVPCRKDDRGIVVPGVSTVRSVGNPRRHCQVGAYDAVSQSTNKVVVYEAGIQANRKQSIDTTLVDSVRRLWLTRALYAAKMRASMSPKALPGDFSPCTVRYAFVEHFR